ncbi:hypothetical protein HU200_048619 [Digitaria exilis]|uniref:J domain-containing protein n=1 Tax=Digitaria exilis TaxID=1010633 RepID=A0A835AV65_9POAL|nr:hypothetical protein HU200_048619 [Digitaria exilis]
MEFNREEAVRARRIALKKLEKRDFSGAQKVALQAQRLYPELENLSQLLTVCKVYCAAEERINRQLNWYGILQVEVTADDTVIRKKYDELVFWLHPNKNTLPGAEAAFELVSEAHMILCDHVNRSRYDIKIQDAHLSNKTLANRSGVVVKPYDVTVVFWTICPHCQKRFVCYQRNFLVSCDDCGKNFFAFKLNEQAVPSRFLLAAPNNYQVSQEMVFCQHAPDQLVQNSILHATGGSVDSTHTDEPVKWAGISDGYGEDSSETRSNIVQCSAVNETHSSSPSADKDNVSGTENQVEQVLITVDHQDDATLEDSQQKYKEQTGIANQMHVNPVIAYECPDFFDFGKLRDVNMIAVNEIWAFYDDHDFMPRVYAQINHVDASNLKVQVTWLEHNPMNGPETRWTREGLPAACGNFCLGETYVLEDPSMYLSHRVTWTKGKNRNSFEIHPKEGEIWALYKESSVLRSPGTDNHQPFNYDFVEVSNVSMNVGFVVTPLVRIEGFRSLFAGVKDKPRILILPSELFRFSHSIPCYRTNGNEKVGVEGLLELDTAALPCDLGSAFPSITLDSYMDLNKKRITESVGVKYPASEFHNFDEDRSCEKLEYGQIWALYSNTDTFPNLYGWINKVEKEPFKVHLTWLKVCPQGVDKHWLEQDIPVSCGKFGMRNLTSEHYETCAFSHLVIRRCQIDTVRQVTIVPKIGEVWAIYKNWAPDWIPSSKDCPAEYAIGEIKMCTGTGTLFAFLTKVHGYISVFKPDAQNGALEVPMNENLRFSHRIPSFRLTKENGGKLRGFYELDPAAVPEILLYE